MVSRKSAVLWGGAFFGLTMFIYFSVAQPMGREMVNIYNAENALAQR